MKLYLVRLTACIFTVMALRAGEAFDPTQLSAVKYAKEIPVWHNALQSLKHDCSLEDACAVLLKFEDRCFFEATASLPSSSSDCAQGKCLDDYKRELHEMYSSLVKTVFTGTLEEACAFMIKSKKRSRGIHAKDRYFLHEKASKSYLWPSLKDPDEGKHILNLWWSICSELVPDCTLLQASNIILMHQVATILKGSLMTGDLEARCLSTMHSLCNLFSRLNPNLCEIDAYTFCIKYPLKVLTDREAHMYSDKLHYVDNYSEFIKGHSTKHLLECSYKIIAHPQMSKVWQEVVLAGYPEELKFILRTVKKKAHFPEMLKEHRFMFLYGYPGGGKTSAAYISSIILHRPLLEICCAGLQTKYRGAAVENLENLLKPIFNTQDPWVICLDEIDALQKTDGANEQSSTSLGRSHVLTVLQTMASANNNPNAMIIATSNYNEVIPESIMSRIGWGSKNIPLPNYEARRKIAAAYLKEKNLYYSRQVLDIIAKQTGGYLPGSAGLSGRAIYQIVSLMRDLVAEATEKIPMLSMQDEPYRVTPEIAARAAELVRSAISQAGQPTTAEGRFIKECYESKNFWPAVNAGISLVNTGISFWNTMYNMKISDEQLGIARAGLRLQESADRRAEREEHRSILLFETEQAADKRDMTRFDMEQAADKRDMTRFDMEQAADKRDKTRFDMEQASDKRDMTRFDMEQAADKRDKTRFDMEQAADKRSIESHALEKRADERAQREEKRSIESLQHTRDQSAIATYNILELRLPHESMNPWYWGKQGDVDPYREKLRQQIYSRLQESYTNN